jgi:putative SOS response-associated peptidase YedK
MISNYSISTPSNSIKEKFSLDSLEAFEPNYNAQPTQSLPVITSKDPDQLQNFNWGIVGDFTKNKSVSEKLLYAPIEEIPQKASLKSSLQHKRCAVIADGFYSWKSISKKGLTPYRLFLNNNECFAMAGLWTEYNTDEDKVYHTFKIITAPAVDNLTNLTERIPVIINEDLLIEWLNPTTQDDSLLDFLTNTEASKLQSYPINPKLKDPQFNSEELWKEVPPADQFGNLTLFS